MAKRIAFIVNDVEIKEQVFDFKYYSGFAISQKQKCVMSLHEEIKKIYNGQILEISSKSLTDLGKNLSAFNLKVRLNDLNISLENIFQASKVFEKGGPYIDLLYVSPMQAKKDERIRNSGKLITFRFNNNDYPINPKTLFYDWIYCRALRHYENYISELMNYSIFTDIEFNHEKAYNCQARSIAIFVYLNKKGLIDEALSNIASFSKFAYAYYKSIYENKTIFTLDV